MKQKALFAELADEDMDLIVVSEEKMTADHKKLSEGFPAFMNIKKGFKSPGYLDSKEKLEALLDMK